MRSVSLAGSVILFSALQVSRLIANDKAIAAAWAALNFEINIPAALKEITSSEFVANYNDSIRRAGGRSEIFFACIDDSGSEYILIQGFTPSINNPINEQSFQLAKQIHKSASSIDDEASLVLQNLQRKLSLRLSKDSGADLHVSVGKILVFSPHLETENAISQVTLADEAAILGRGSTELYPTAGTISLINKNGRLITLQHRIMLTPSTDIDNLKRKSLRLISEILAAVEP